MIQPNQNQEAMRRSLQDVNVQCLRITLGVAEEASAGWCLRISRAVQFILMSLLDSESRKVQRNVKVSSVLFIGMRMIEEYEKTYCISQKNIGR